ncbi:deoxyguanosinetriphosphate triphosphohydrolase family protein [Streptomyces sp. NPDC052016]|uniref:deoxyguanosinetriphosphate triphosphohydrolase family protein n=1 Tax=Streptomyces sp. NPDC052016 TaxID=3365680 RepID=UPI0037CF7958
MSNFSDREPYNPSDRAYEGKEDHGRRDPLGRSRFEQDRDRILYCSAFRRLAGVTQTSAVSERRLLHTRLTHSLKVAQIGRRICQRLANDNRDLVADVGLYPDVVEAAGLAHDLGHPPFGHVTEKELDEQTKRVCGGFEGNAQTFRIVTKLAVRREPPERGLDLTRETLNAVLKYPLLRPGEDDAKEADLPPWTNRSYGRKWGSYSTEKRDLRFARRSASAADPHVRSPNAIIMDWADDIGFATHDIDDYFRSGMIPLENPKRDLAGIMAHAGKRYSDYPYFESDDLAQAYEEICKFALPRPFSGSRMDRYSVHHFASTMIKRAVDAVSIQEDPPYIHIGADIQYQIEALKELTWYYVIESPALAVLQEGQRRLVNGLYEMLYSWLSGSGVSHKSPSARIPVGLSSIIKGLVEDEDAAGLSRDARNSRAVCDYICTLTEDQALDIYERMYGTYRGSLFGAWY